MGTRACLALVWVAPAVLCHEARAADPEIGVLQAHRFMRPLGDQSWIVSIREWLTDHWPQLGVTTLEIPTDGGVFAYVGPDEPCSTECGGRWPDGGSGIVLSAGTHGGPYGPLTSFIGIDDFDVLLVPPALANPLHARIAPDCPDARAAVAGSPECPCHLSYDDMLEYVERYLLALHRWCRSDPANDAWSRVRGLRFNMEYNPIPKRVYAMDDSGRDPQPRHGIPAVCDATIDRWNARTGLQAGAPEGTLEAFLRDAVYDFPELVRTVDGAPRGIAEWAADDPSIAWRSVAQIFTLGEDDAISRIDVRALRLGDGRAQNNPWYWLSAVDDAGEPILSDRTGPRVIRRSWLPDRTRETEWVPLYFDPLEVSARFDPGERVALVLCGSKTFRSEPEYGAVVLDASTVPEGDAYALDTPHGAAPLTHAGVRSLDADLAFRVWRSRDPSSRAHEKFVAYQLDNMGRIFADIRDRLDRHEELAHLEIVPFCHMPDDRIFGVERREYYGFDFTHPDVWPTISYIYTWTAAQTLGKIRDAGRIHSAGQSTSYGLVRRHRDAFDAVRLGFVAGGLNVWQDTYAPSGPRANEAWRDSTMAFLAGVFDPIREFADHYRYVDSGRGFPDSTRIPGSRFDAEAWSLRIPASDSPTGRPLGHVLLTSQRLTGGGAGQVRIRDAVPDAWWGAFSRRRLVTDSLVVLEAARRDVESEPARMDLSVCSEIQIPTVQLEGWYQRGSTVAIRHQPTHRQPGQLLTTVESAYCAGDAIDVTWTPVPEVCREAYELGELRTRLSLHRRLPGGSAPLVAERTLPASAAHATMPLCERADVEACFDHLAVFEFEIRVRHEARVDDRWESLTDERTGPFRVAPRGGVPCPPPGGGPMEVVVEHADGGFGVAGVLLASMGDGQPGWSAVTIPPEVTSIAIRANERVWIDYVGFGRDESDRPGTAASITGVVGFELPSFALERAHDEGTIVPVGAILYVDMPSSGEERALLVHARRGSHLPGADTIRVRGLPGQPSMSIEYTIATGAHTSVAVFDVTGRRVRSLVDEHRLAGTHRLTWDRRDDRGRAVAAGVYLLRLRLARRRTVEATSVVVVR